MQKTFGDFKRRERTQRYTSVARVRDISRNRSGSKVGVEVAAEIDAASRIRPIASLPCTALWPSRLGVVDTELWQEGPKESRQPSPSSSSSSSSPPPSSGALPRVEPPSPPVHARARGRPAIKRSA